MSESDFEVQLRRALQSPPPPAAWVERAVQQWDHRSWAAQPGPRVAVAPSGMRAAVQATLHQLVAHLRFDSWAPQAGALAVRAGAGGARHLVFSVPGCDVDVRIVAAGAHHALSGQVLGPDAQGRLDLMDARGAHCLASALLNDLGEFRFDALDGGVYQLMLVQGEHRVVLSPLELGPAASGSEEAPGAST